MSIRVDVVRIAGFRGIANLEITLPRITVLIGTNNSGKTSILKALQLALGDYSRYLNDEDFHIDRNDKRCEQILVDVRIVPVDENDTRKQLFDDEWLEEFGDNIQAEADGHQFLALRNQCQPDKVKGGFITARFALERWPEFDHWQQEKPSPRRQLRKRFEALPFISIDAQRDIHQELKEKSSFVGRVLSSIEYDDEDVKQLEKLVAQINQEAVDKSAPLKGLKHHLDALNHSFQGNGEAELTPFPKKIRDLSKRFSVYFGESKNNSFSMEYHGMGTRSWASMLTVKAFIELISQQHHEEAKPFFPIMAAEEPEAHLHPNAQRTLYQQLMDSKGQVIISTHSPYLAALANMSELRSLSRSGASVSVKMLSDKLDQEEQRKIRREVIYSRGELLFANVIVLLEGETEAQALPQLFTAYYDKEPFSLGINFIGVNGSGAKYRPFLQFSHDLNIPVFIFSDGEEKTKKELKKHWEKVFGESDIDNSPFITILNNTDFEGYLFESGLEDVIEEAINNVDGEGFIDAWMDKKHNTPLRPIRTNKPPCQTCHQPIFDSPLRDYSGEGGRQRAMLEIVDAKKPQYAQAIANQLCQVGSNRFPPKLIEFYGKIMAKVYK